MVHNPDYLQSNQGKHIPQDNIHELIIAKLNNPLVVSRIWLMDRSIMVNGSIVVEPLFNIQIPVVNSLMQP